jgi:hypothetical protein
VYATHPLYTKIIGTWVVVITHPTIDTARIAAFRNLYTTSIFTNELQFAVLFILLVATIFAILSLPIHTPLLLVTFVYGTWVIIITIHFILPGHTLSVLTGIPNRTNVTVVTRDTTYRGMDTLPLLDITLVLSTRVMVITILLDNPVFITILTRIHVTGVLWLIGI